MFQRFSQLLRGRLAQNILALYGMQFVQYALPLVTVPFLARVLGPEGWGTVAFAQGYGAYVGLFTEYGFEFSATRDIARSQGQRDQHLLVLRDVLGAKLLIAAGAVAITLAIEAAVPTFRQAPTLLWLGTIWGLGVGFRPTWFFLGLERMRIVAVLEVAAKVVVTAAIFAVVRSPRDTTTVLVIYAGAIWAATLAAYAVIYHQHRFLLPRPTPSIRTLRSGWTLFILRGGISLYTAGNAFIVGLFAPAAVVGYYTGAEKIAKAAVGMMSPVTKALFPRLSSLVGTARAEAVRIARRSMAALAITGLAGGSVLLLLAPVLVRILLGDSYAASVLPLRIFALLPPLIGVSNVLGLQWMIPIGLERQFARVVYGAGVLNFGLAVLLAPVLGQDGMALAVVSAEVFVTVTLALVLQRLNLSPVGANLRSWVVNDES